MSPDHRLFVCRDLECLCVFHLGSLTMCTACHGVAGAMPTECPGFPMSAPELDGVAQSRWDYRDGAWIQR